MNTKKRLNCYVFSNLMISFLALNVLTNNQTTELVKKTGENTLESIYKEEIIVETVDVPDVILSSATTVSNVVTVSNKTLKSKNTNYNEYTDYVKPSYNSLTGTNLVNYARKFLGLRYVSAGNSLVTGTDCSGFTRLIYGEFGISLGRTVGSQIYSGTYVSKNDLEPGDLVFYSYGSVASHVAIYMGNGLIIHESNPRDGVKISSVNIMNYITARRLITSNVVSSNNQVETTTTEPKQEVVETPTQEIVKNDVIVEEKKETDFIEITNEETSTETVTDTKEQNSNEIINETNNEEKTKDMEEIQDNSTIIENDTVTRDNENINNE